MQNPFDDIDLDATAELPKMASNSTHTTNIPSFKSNNGLVFPDMPEELNTPNNSSNVMPSFEQFQKKPISDEDKSATLPSFHTHMSSEDTNEPFLFDVPDRVDDAPEKNENTVKLDTNNSGGNNNIPPVINNPKNADGKKKKQQKKGAFKKDTTVLNIIVTIITVVMNVLVTYIMLNITKFASISQSIFLMINIGVLIALVLLDLLVILMIRTKMIYLFVMSIVVLSLFVGAGGYGFYALNRVNKNVDKITGDTKEEDVSASLVIYNGTSGDPITDVKDLEGRKVGISSGTTTAEIAKKKLESEGVSVEYVESTGYTDLLSNLISGNVDCAVLPVSYQSQFSEDENLVAYLPDTQSILDFSDTVTSTATSGSDKDITKEPFTVLVTGENEGLADSIILMSVNPVSMKVTMTSIARDSYVPIACYGSSDKINSAHAASEDCMVKTVENLMGIDIDYTIEFNFASVIQVVDAVGGVDVDIDVSFNAQCWDVEKDALVVLPLNAGKNQHLNGQQTLGFVRERYAFPDGDFARQRHQQEVIEQIISKVMSSKDPNMFLNILDAAGNNIKTNFTVNQMTGFINYALQKAKRYYDTNSISGLFNFESSRVYGYAADLWNSSLQMNLWIYRLYNGSIQDCANAIKRNLNLEETPSQPVAVSWSAANTYTPDPVSQETYDEARITDSGKPAEEVEPVEPTYTPTAPTEQNNAVENTNTSSSANNAGSSTSGGTENVGSSEGSGNAGTSGDTGDTGESGGSSSGGESTDTPAQPSESPDSGSTESAS